MRFKLFLLAVFFISSCASTITRPTKATKAIKPSISKAKVKTQTVKYRQSAVQKPKTKYIIKKKYITHKITDFRLNYHDKHYKFWINYFDKKSKARFKRFISNGDRYKDIIEKTFEKEGLPKELYYVGLIESGYQNHAKSWAGAVGPWQFIKGTGTRYGLRIDRYVDERKNIYKSTLAAAKYFKDLYNIFGSWELALCAYNAGEYRIINAIRKGNTRDYRTLVQKKLIPKETIFYVPKVAAAKALAKKKEYKKIKNHTREKFNNATPLRVTSSFSLKSMAKRLKLSTKKLKSYNPDIRWDWVKIRRRGFDFFVPNHKFDTAMAYIKGKRKVASNFKVYRPTTGRKTYRVRRGDNLSKIAKRFNTSVRSLKRMNNLRKSKIYVGQRLKVKNAPKTKGSVYVVKKGDSLYRIAKKFGVSINNIVATNNLKRKTIYPSQRLKISSL